MNTGYINPQNMLQDFFLLDRAFAFHDQTRQPEDYTYGSFTPQVVLNKAAGQISALQLMISPAGGMSTFVAPKQPVDTSALDAYIRAHFIPSPGGIKLIQSDVRQTLFLRFVHQPESDSYDVEYVQSRMALTHAESSMLDSAIRGDKNQVYLLTHSQFDVSSYATARLQTDWIAFLTLAFNENARKSEAIALLLNQQIDAGVITLQEQFDNTPSAQTRALVKNSLVETASALISNTLRNIHSVDELPTKISYDISYSNSVPQQYLLVQQQDIAVLLDKLPADSIITFSTTPLPEPSRPRKPIIPRECTVSLDFQPANFNILSIELCYEDVQTPMPWPTFSPVTLKTESDTDIITLRVEFADYSRYESSLTWQDDIALTPQDLGFYSVLFEADHLKSSFKSIKGSANYLPAGQANKQSFIFTFPSSQGWLANWWINTQFAGLNGNIDYSWTGELQSKSLFRKTYNAGHILATASPIKLHYNK